MHIRDIAAEPGPLVIGWSWSIGPCRCIDRKSTAKTLYPPILPRSLRDYRSGVSSGPLDVLEALKPGGVLHIDYSELLAAAGGPGSQDAFGRSIEGEWAWLYERETPGPRDLRATRIESFTWLIDATESPKEWEAENRLVGVYGTSVPPAGPRDRARIAGFPSPERHSSGRLHRGHAVGHSLGGPDEGYNLFGQNASVNLGREWRGLERYGAAHPGTFLFVRAVYIDISSMPAALEYGLIRQDGSLDVRQFDNRASAPAT